MVQVFAVILAFELFLQLGAIAVSAWRIKQWNAEVSQKKDGELVILCVGESTTEWGGENSYPSLLQKFLQEKLQNSKVRVVNGGRAAFDSARLHALLPAFLSDAKPKIVVFMMGINDPLYLPTPGISRSQLWLQSWLSWSRIWRLIELAHFRSQVANNFETNPKQFEELHTLRSTPRSPTPMVGESFFRAADTALRTGHWSDAAKNFSKFLSLQSSAYDYFRVGDAYYWRDSSARFRAEAARYLERSYQINPKLLETQWLWGKYLASVAGRENQSKKVIKAAIESGNQNADLFISLADVYHREKKLQLEVETLESGLKISKGQTRLFLFERLVRFCNQGLLPSKRNCVELWKMAINEYPNNPLLMSLAPNQIASQENVLQLLQDSRNYAYHPRTRLEYRGMIEEVQKFGALAVVMQYPTLEIKPLKEMLGGVPNLAFVENRILFSEALKHQPYQALFTDNFARSFGHTTEIGSELIAKNLTETIYSILK